MIGPVLMNEDLSSLDTPTPKGTARDQLSLLVEVFHSKNTQIIQMTNYIHMYEQQIQTLQAKEYDSCMDLVKKNSELDQSIIQLKEQVDTLTKDKRSLDSDLFAARDEIKELIKEKHAIEQKYHSYERVTGQAQADLDYQLHTLRSNLAHCQGENSQLKQQEEILMAELQSLTRARDSFKQQFLELRETHKELKS